MDRKAWLLLGSISCVPLAMVFGWMALFATEGAASAAWAMGTLGLFALSNLTITLYILREC